MKNLSKEELKVILEEEMEFGTIEHHYKGISKEKLKECILSILRECCDDNYYNDVCSLIYGALLEIKPDYNSLKKLGCDFE